jgi:hypothetical protein
MSGASTGGDPALRYWVRVEDANLETIEDVDCYASRAAAISAYWAIVDDPDPDLGSVYVVEVDDYESRVIAGTYLPGCLAR